jgi:hypothetical protein
VPRATQVNGSSAIRTSRPVAFCSTIGRPRSSEPPPASAMPFSTRSAASSGSAFSSVLVTASMIAPTGSWSASRISALVITVLRGRPEIMSRPRTSIEVSSPTGAADPISILIRSEVCSPIIRLYVRFMWLMIASSMSSPATRTISQVAMSASDMIATSVVPPPMSTIIDAVGSANGSPAPIAAAMGSSSRKVRLAPARSAESNTARFSTAVMPLGIEMTTRGPIQRIAPSPS